VLLYCVLNCTGREKWTFGYFTAASLLNLVEYLYFEIDPLLQDLLLLLYLSQSLIILPIFTFFSPLQALFDQHHLVQPDYALLVSFSFLHLVQLPTYLQFGTSIVTLDSFQLTPCPFYLASS